MAKTRYLHGSQAGPHGDKTEHLEWQGTRSLATFGCPAGGGRWRIRPCLVPVPIARTLTSSRRLPGPRSGGMGSGAAA
jgi:hypothetical protein